MFYDKISRIVGLHNCELLMIIQVGFGEWAVFQYFSDDHKAFAVAQLVAMTCGLMMDGQEKDV